MKKLFAVATLFIPFAVAGCAPPRSYYPPPPPPPAYSEAAQQGYHDGVDAASVIFHAERRPIPTGTLASATRLCLHP